ncbi:sulfurtransferase [Streptomyces sp. NBC_00683]|uniref:sulfurtransferase n=1 Tax=Streptomyces sp. NBC_00683 TaxID=2903670 RepID=UPI002E369B84|nr:sulfurtransferase [Streptomyces sp. NBC_00683]
MTDDTGTTDGSGTAGGVGSLPGPLVGADWLAARIADAGLVVLDASVGAHREAGLRIPGARRFDIDGVMSDDAGPLPHTMPGARRFTEEMRALGVDGTDTVVVYDAAGIYSSARAWWMLRAMGFDRVAVLDGGLPAWTAAGLPVERAGKAQAAQEAGCAKGGAERAGDFTALPRDGMLVGSGAVVAALADPRSAVLDARSRERFAGTGAEPRPGLRPGHMPGALNLPFGEIQRDGRMLPAEELRASYRALAGERERLVVSCGSGVTACVLALGAELAGYREVSVYDGSWSEWGRPSELPVVTGE